jgi:hypothetical protein
MQAIAFEWWLRPVSMQARLGEQSGGVHVAPAQAVRRQPIDVRGPDRRSVAPKVAGSYSLIATAASSVCDQAGSNRTAGACGGG